MSAALPDIVASNREAGDQGSISWLLVVGVFFVFGPIGVLIGFLQPEPPGWLIAVLMCAMSGGLAVGWVIAINKRGVWLLLIPLMLALPFGFPWLFGMLDWSGVFGVGTQMSELARGVIMVVAACVQLSVGFTLVIRYVTMTERREARQRVELDLARRIQAELAPPVDVAGAWGRAVGLSVASNSMGGDLIDVVDHGDSADVILADVSGHGVRAGVVMAMLKTSFRGAATGDRRPESIASAVNEAMVSLTAGDVFATAWLLRVRREGLVACVGCGHPPLFRLARDGSPTQIVSDSMPLGVLREAEFASSEIGLAEGERLLLYSDGLTEARYPNGEMIGLAGLERLIRRVGSEDVSALPSRVLSAVTDISTTDDDLSVLAVTRSSA